MDLDYSLTFAEQYGINPQEFADVHVTSLPLSVRVTNRFQGNQIHTVAQLLAKTPADLMSISGFGRGCLDELDRILVSIQANALSEPVKKARSSNKLAFLYRPKILAGDFSFVEDEALSKKDLETVLEIQNAYDMLGPELVSACASGQDAMLDIILMLKKFCFSAGRRTEINELINNIPAYRRQNIVRGYIHAYTQDEDKRELLVSQYNSADSRLGDFIGQGLENENTFLQVKKFFKWCTFNLSEDVETLLQPLFDNNRLKTVIEMRARKNTLERTGNKLNVTRERIRQLEAKALRIFAKYQGRIKLIAKISAEKNSNSIITPADIERYCENFSVELLYLLRNYNSSIYTYDAQLDVFIIGDDSIHERVYSYVETLPDFFSVKDLPQIIETAKEEHDLSGEMVEKAVCEAYRSTGDVFHRCRLSLGAIYTAILKEHYPNGIMAYDPEEIKRFRSLVTATYGEVNMPANDRALTARIAGICVLCGKGMYRLKQKQYIPKELAQRIYNYITESEYSIFLTNTLFAVFEEDLLKAGVDNKYYLQGILHELYGDKLVFRRDYVSKDGGETSIYSSVMDLVQASRYPVSKSQIQEAFPGIPDIVISFAVGDPSILNYFGEYLHASKLTIAPEEERYLNDVISRMLTDQLPHHIEDVYEIIDNERPEILTRNAARFPFSAFSVLEYLFRDSYQFVRPYIAAKGVKIGRPSELLHDLLYSSEQFTFDDISDFCRENHYTIQSQLEFVNSCNDAYLIINNSTVMAIDKIGVTATIAQIVEDAIADEINCTMPINQLTGWAKFPSLNVPWTDWLVYSVLAKWATKVDVAPSFSQFRMAIPLVAPKGLMDVSPFAEAYKDPAQMNGTSVEIDDLDNIDDLLANLLGDDLLEDKIWG